LPEGRDYGIVNRFAIAALRKETITLFGGGKQLRDYLHVSDAAAAILRAFTSERAIAEMLNVEAGSSVSLREIAERIVELAGSGKLFTVPWPKTYERTETGDFVCDTNRIARVLDWKPVMDLETGLRNTIQFYREALTDIGRLIAEGRPR
jgi:nucleoside-diphosphate-sugar epimerase